MITEGKSMPDIIRDLGVSEQTYYRWKRQYGGSDKKEILNKLAVSILWYNRWVQVISRLNFPQICVGASYALLYENCI